MGREKVEGARDGRGRQRKRRRRQRRHGRRDVCRGRDVSRGRRGLEELLDRCLEIGGFEGAVAEDMFGPEGEEKLEIGTVHRAWRRIAGV